MFCERSNLNNEADVETWFVDRLLSYLNYSAEDIRLKTSIKSFVIGQGSKSSLYKPDFVVFINRFPTLVIDAKNPSENIGDWTSQCSSYCLEINKQYEHNPVEYYMITNGLSTAIYKWDKESPLIKMDFADFYEGSIKLLHLNNLIGKMQLEKSSNLKHERHMDSYFDFRLVSLDEISTLFHKLHQFIWKTEKKSPSSSFEELIKIIFIKIRKDKELHSKLPKDSQPKVKDVIFSVAWIKNQTENEDPINNPLFRNLLTELEREIREKNKKRIFDVDEEINLHPKTIEKIVSELEHIDFVQMDEDIHGRMFESFLDATVRGTELGQFFTPRDIVKLMVELADIHVSKNRLDTVLDACCGSGGFLISAMSNMMKKCDQLVGMSSLEKNLLKRKIVDQSIVGIDAGSYPPIHRIARMNMYLHGDGGSRIYFADSLDKTVGQIGKSNFELDEEILELRKLLINDNKKFDVILSNPPFSMTYSRTHIEQQQILDQYELSVYEKKSSSLLSSTMFVERYKDLVSEDGRIFAVIDDSILSGESFKFVRDYIRQKFIIIGVISLPGDAFRHADSRVKTSIIILRLKKNDEQQSDVFMERSTYLGLTEKVAKRIGIKENELKEGKKEDHVRILKNYKKFLEGIRTDYVIDNTRLNNRLDVKFCLHDNGRLKPYWLSKNVSVVPLHSKLKVATNRSVRVTPDKSYTFLKVTYDGEVIESETKFGDEISYSTLYMVKEWDILYSNMGMGRGAISIVPAFYAGKYVSSEYTILSAFSKEEALFYTNLLRTKEILGDILSSTTGMNRGRIKWGDLDIEVPLYNSQNHDMKEIVKLLETHWDAYFQYHNKRDLKVRDLASALKVDTEESRKRWLAYKPPE